MLGTNFSEIYQKIIRKYRIEDRKLVFPKFFKKENE
jgi:hypothetical protein